MAQLIVAKTQDRDCAAGLIKQVLRKYPIQRKLFADGGSADGGTNSRR